MYLYYTSSQKALLAKKYNYSKSMLIPTTNIYLNKNINKNNQKEMKNLYSRGYDIHDIYYDGDNDIETDVVYKQPEFKTCQVKQLKTEIEVLIEKGYDVYDIY